MTGAQIPEGADAVVMLELTKPSRKTAKLYGVEALTTAGRKYIKTGEDARKGSVLVKKEPG